MGKSTEVIVVRESRLKTPEERVRRLQERLHLSAKREAERRFHQLYDKVWSEWVLRVAWKRVKANRGAAGPDGQTIEEVEAAGVEVFLESLSRELREHRYRTGPVRRVYIPKANGKKRPLGIPNVRDRVVQTAVELVLGPILEADLPETAFGFRPGRNAHQAMDSIREHLQAGRTDVVDADLKSYFDTIPHDNLMKLVARRIVDRGILHLIQQWLEAAVIEPDAPESSAGKKNDQGTPQGGVISPLLANLYHACIPHLWEGRGHARQLDGKFVSYADDFVILLPPGRGAKALAPLRSICERLALQLSEEKTRVVRAMSESFPFLGFEVQKVKNPKTGKWYSRVVPTKKSEQHVRDRVREILNRRTCHRAVGDVVKEVNQVVRGWGGHTYYGTPQKSMRRINHFTEQRLRKWLMRKHDRRGPGYSHYPSQVIYGPLGLYRLPTVHPARHANA
jgi:RNA-directed DNA polymerase